MGIGEPCIWQGTWGHSCGHWATSIGDGALVVLTIWGTRGAEGRAGANTAGDSNARRFALRRPHALHSVILLRHFGVSVVPQSVHVAKGSLCARGGGRSRRSTMREGRVFVG